MQDYSKEKRIKRKLLLYIVFICLTILCGLVSRSTIIPLPIFVSTYAGDTLWALMVFWCFCVFFPQWKTWKIFLVSIFFSFTIEFSQFYHTPWIDTLRQNTLGALVLGFGFKFSDLICYSIGITLGAFIDRSLLKMYYH